MMRNFHTALLIGASAFALSKCYAMADDQGTDELLDVVEFEENLEDVEKPPELPAGTYTGEVQDVQIKTSGAGNRYYAIKFVIPADEVPADLRNQLADGAVLYWNRQIVPKQDDARAKFNLRKLVEAFDLPTSTNRIDPNEWMGCKARLKIRMGKYNGEERAEIASVDKAEARAPRQAASRGAAPARGKGKRAA